VVTRDGPEPEPREPRGLRQEPPHEWQQLRRPELTDAEQIAAAQRYAARRYGPPVAEPSITCPLCGATSYHPQDIGEGYCGRCHDWTSPPGARADDPPLLGCTCGGIGATGSHRPGCPWAAAHG
jgi:hypothetical protein